MSVTGSAINKSLVVGEWMLATLFGWLAGVALGVALTFAVRPLPFVNEDRFVVYAVLFSLGITVGLTQWIVLRHFLLRPLPWLAATFVGYLLCFAIISFANRMAFAAASTRHDVLLFTVMGVAVGVPQALVLSRDYRGAAVWVLASIASFMAFFWLVANPTNSPGQFLLMASLVAAVGSAVPGLVLVWLTGRPAAVSHQR